MIKDVNLHFSDEEIILREAEDEEAYQKIDNILSKMEALREEALSLHALEYSEDASLMAKAIFVNIEKIGNEILPVFQKGKTISAYAKIKRFLNEIY